jgi:ABC-2 type transport system ATP-binding protein
VDNEPVVDVEDLVRVFSTRGGWRSHERETRALDGLSISIPAGEVHGLLGPNGAGKTTLVKILSTVLLPTSGTARVGGFDVVNEGRKVRSLIGLVFGGEKGLYPRISGRQNLRYWGALYGLSAAESASRTDTLLERLGLIERADARVETYSRGMKQRLHLARGLIGDPRILFLDEPTTGMDPLAALDFRRFVAELKTEGRSIFLTTHDMKEAEAVCDRVTLIDHGKVIAAESPAGLSRLISRFERVDVHGVPSDLLDEVGRIPGVSNIHKGEDGSARIETAEADATAQVVRRLVDAGVTSMSTSLPTLEEVYVHLIGDRGLQL